MDAGADIRRTIVVILSLCRGVAHTLFGMIRVFSHRFSGLQDVFIAYLMQDYQQVLVRTQNKINIYDLKSRRLVRDFSLPYATHQYDGQPSQLYRNKYYELLGNKLVVYDLQNNSYEEAILGDEDTIHHPVTCYLGMGGQIVLQDRKKRLLIVALVEQQVHVLQELHAELVQIQVPYFNQLMFVDKEYRTSFLPERIGAAIEPPRGSVYFYDQESSECISVNIDTSEVAINNKKLVNSVSDGQLQLLHHTMYDGFLVLSTDGGAITILSGKTIQRISGYQCRKLDPKALRVPVNMPQEVERRLTQPQKEQLERQNEIMQMQIQKLQRKLADLDEQNCYLKLQLYNREQSNPKQRRERLPGYVRDYRKRFGREPMLFEKIQFLSDSFV